eukprot:TRINITY_DN74954_c0_g1_i1.p1 TRINITY_DN74954_c0_g1~~TRINITY_DN74954_c0_g1_i1.p1  ORF type:complete len:381 (+),score=70.04 TRINITY_DN74954_c0_g1_i1:94-1236(+)
MLEGRVLTRSLSFLCIEDICPCRCVAGHWRESSDERDIWMALGTVHFSKDLAATVVDRQAFKELVLSIRDLLGKEREERQQNYMVALHKLARCPRPLPGRADSGVDLLVAAKSHLRMVALVRMDDGTEWTGDLPPEKQDLFFLWAVETLELLCARSPIAKADLRGAIYDSNGNLILSEVLSQHLLHALPKMSSLGPKGMVDDEDEDDMTFTGFRSMDCRRMPEHDCLPMLRALVSLLFHLFAKDSDVPGEFECVSLAEAEYEVAAAELSGKWCTAMALQHQRVDGVPGDLDLSFQDDGTVTGAGRDSWGEFTTEGFWTKKFLFMRKVTPRGYYVDLFGFLQPDGSVRGAWLFNARTGAWWGWKGMPRSFPSASHAHNQVA